MDTIPACKAPGGDGMPLDLFKIMWHIIGEDFYVMIMDSIRKGGFYERVSKELINLILRKGTLRTSTMTLNII